MPDSTSPNAIYIDMVVLTRGEPDREFVPLLNDADTAAKGGSKLPSGWTVDGKSADVSVSGSPDLLKISLKAGAKAVTLLSPAVPCGAVDVLQIQTDYTGSGGRMGILFYDREGKLIQTRGMSLKGASGHREMVADPTTGLKLCDGIATCRFFVTAKSSGTVRLDNLKITRAEEFNRKF